MRNESLCGKQMITILHRNGTNAFLKICAKIICICKDSYHALIALSPNHIFSALALSALLFADLRYRAISMALTGCKRGEERVESSLFKINYVLMAEFLHEYIYLTHVGLTTQDGECVYFTPQ